nr:MAG TPA: hypothetical protein [Caudoviricetes sp.]
MKLKTNGSFLRHAKIIALLFGGYKITPYLCNR